MQFIYQGLWEFFFFPAGSTACWQRKCMCGSLFQGERGVKRWANYRSNHKYIDWWALKKKKNEEATTKSVNKAITRA